MEITKEEFERLKKRTPEQLEEDIKGLIKEIELRYKTSEEQIEEIGYAVGNEPFESWWPDKELILILEELAEGKPRIIREAVYKLVFQYNLIELLLTILDGFDAFINDEYNQRERARVREVEEQEDIIKFARARCPDFKVTYSLLDPVIKLYQKGVAHFYYEEKKKKAGRYPDTQINNLIKKFYKILLPILNSMQSSKPEKRTRIFISRIFRAFYRYEKDEKAIEKTILKNEPTD